MNYGLIAFSTSHAQSCVVEPMPLEPHLLRLMNAQTRAYIQLRSCKMTLLKSSGMMLVSCILTELRLLFPKKVRQRLCEDSVLGGDRAFSDLSSQIVNNRKQCGMSGKYKKFEKPCSSMLISYFDQNDAKIIIFFSTSV